jgi:hypothetical protein
MEWKCRHNNEMNCFWPSKSMYNLDTVARYSKYKT